MNSLSNIQRSAVGPRVDPFSTRTTATDVDGLPTFTDPGASHDVRLPHSGAAVADPAGEVADVQRELDQLLHHARTVVNSFDRTGVDVHRILMNIAKQTREDQQGGLEQAEVTIETNRRLREQIQELVSKIQEELQKLQEEIADLQAEIEGHNTFEKMGEGIKSAFGGGDGKELQKKQANMTIQQGRLQEAEARLETAKKLIEHGHELMETSVQDLKKVVERINASIQLLKQAVDGETKAVGRA